MLLYQTIYSNKKEKDKMVKLTATFIALSATTTAVLAGYSQDACQYSYNDNGRYVYSCEESKCSNSITWVKDHFQESMSDKGYDCRMEGDKSVSCYKPHDHSDPYSHNWSCSDKKHIWDHIKDTWEDIKDEVEDVKDRWDNKDHHDKRGYKDYYGKHKDHREKYRWDHKDHHSKNRWDSKDHHDKRGYEDEHRKEDRWDHKKHQGKNKWGHKERHGKDKWDHEDKHYGSRYQQPEEPYKSFLSKLF